MSQPTNKRLVTEAAQADALATKADATDARLTDARTPVDGSVTNAKVAANAAISADKLADGTTGKVLTAAERTKLTGVATAATANSPDATLLARANHTGTQSADTLTDGTTNKAFLATERTKLTGIAAGATANATDATLLARANHTGTQAASTVTGLATVATSGSYTDLTGKPTIPAAYTDAQAVAANASAIAAKESLLTPTATKTAAYTAAVGELAVMNVAGGATSLTLPAAPADKSQVAYLAIGSTTAAPLTITPGGTDTIGTAGGTSVVEPLGGVTRTYQYQAANTRWLVIADVKPLSALDGRYAQVSTLGTKADTRAPYLGPVSNRCRIPSSVIGSSTYRQVKTWRVYRATDKIPAVALIYAGFTGTNEAAATAPGAVSAVVEYPAGTYTRVTFGGSNTGTIPAAGMVQSDLTTLLTTIPAGARYWIGTLVTWDAGLNMPRYQDGMAWDTVAAGQMRESAAGSSTVSMTDDLMTGTRLNGSISSKTGDSYGPCAILGMTQKPTVFIAGDSRAMGQFATANNSQDAEGITGEIEQILGNRVGYINAALNSDSHTLANTGTNYANRLALSQFCTHIIDQYGVNSIYTQALAANTTDLTTFRAKFPATKPFYAATTTPKVTGNMILADLSDQSPGGTLANLTAWNQFIRSGANGLIDGCIDLEAVTSPSINTGKITPAQKVVTDAAITTGTNTLTSATAGFLAGDVGKWVAIVGAGASAATLNARIGAVTNATTVTLTNDQGDVLNASTTVTGATAGIGLSSYDGTHQTRLRESAIRESQLMQRVIGPILQAVR